ncbi:tetratricopeptide repeat protein [Reticulibacter mediterranei]|uniref:tetratricopeptide repeat protein n=1 Tax=Reticulibacter mediterranei TaxID=2778369 RepID=UPI001C68EDB8|nr:tetratricopeptide repeat protein [Reticulibacter mediterranei]
MEYHLQLVETAGAELAHGPHMLQATQRLKQELENIRVALAFVIGQQAAEVAFRFCCALAPFWERQSFFDEGRRWISAALGLKEAPSPRLRAQLVLIQGQLYWWEENYTQAKPLFEESRALYQAEGEMHGLARATYMLAETYYYQKLWAQATHYFENCLQLYQDLGDPLGMGNALAKLGGVALFQDHHLEIAAQRLHKSLALLRPCQRPLELFAVLGLLFAVEYFSGNLPAALTHVQEILMLFQTVGLEAFPGHNIATILCACCVCLGGVGAVTVAAQVGGAAEAMFEHLGSRLASVYMPHYEDALKQNRAQVDEAIWMQHWAIGKTLPLQSVISLAIEACQSQEKKNF